MMHYYDTEMLARERRQRLLDDADRARALRRVPRRAPWYAVLYGRMRPNRRGHVAVFAVRAFGTGAIVTPATTPSSLGLADVNDTGS